MEVPKIFRLHYKFTERKLEHTDTLPLNEQIDQIIPQIRKEIPYDVKRTPCPTCNLPSGMCVYKPIYTPDVLRQCYADLDGYYNEHKGDKSFTSQRDGNRIFMFDDMFLKDLLTKTEGTAIGAFIARYVTDILAKFKIASKYHEQIIAESKMPVVRYTSNYGLHMHIDKFRRANGPIVTMSVGAPVYVYDVFNITENKIDPLRIYFKDGNVILMDGSSRVEYAHGLPFGFKYGDDQNRYGFIWLLPKFRVIEKKFSKYYKQWIDTVIKCDGATCDKADPDVECVGDDTGTGAGGIDDNPEAKQGGKPKTKAKAKAKTKSKTKAKSKAKAKSRTRSKTPKPKVRAKTKAGVKAKTKTKSKDQE